MQWFERIKTLRENAGLSQEELSSKAEITQGLLSGLERGKKKFTQNNVDRILKVLGKNYNDIFCEKTIDELELEIKLLEMKLRETDTKKVSDPPDAATDGSRPAAPKKAAK